MNRAIQLAVDNVKRGGQPFGAVLVKGDEIVAEGVNELHIKHDVSGHAELLAIRRAQEKLQIDDLSEFTMYASGEPCAMCLAAMYFVGIQKVYYYASIDDAEMVGLGKSKQIYLDLANQRDKRTIEMIQIPNDETIADPLKQWIESNRS